MLNLVEDILKESNLIRILRAKYSICFKNVIFEITEYKIKYSLQIKQLNYLNLTQFKVYFEKNITRISLTLSK